MNFHDYPPEMPVEPDAETQALLEKMRKFVKENKVAIILPTADQRPMAQRMADAVFMWHVPVPPAQSYTVCQPKPRCK